MMRPVRQRCKLIDVVSPPNQNARIMLDKKENEVCRVANSSCTCRWIYFFGPAGVSFTLFESHAYDILASGG